MTTERLSINQITVKNWSFEEAVRGLARHDIRWIGAWLGPVQEYGVARAAALLREHRMQVSSVCRAGFFTGRNPDGGGLDQAANERAVEVTAALGCDVLYLVAGGVGDDRDIEASRRAVVRGVAELVPHAAAAGVRLAVEPLHPMMCAERSVVVTLEQALDVVEEFDPAHVGLAVDTYNVWWDPAIDAALDRARGRIIGYQVCDWLVPQPHPLFGRGIPGEGAIDIPSITKAVDATGYVGPIEVEIFNEAVWASDPDSVLTTITDRFERSTLPGF
ncbi:sugar phosphate isomerase/epimerase family protein [Pseudonocardia sp. TRM90224]|uniref:sugar phosphate isomerase/epimerase family protein n=1 Tax=Pseudonocardia sp. TRM90224 TaxID=2812678 RepID=UPI001E52BCE6|nr:sugar phosphate isomerase/epimerase family protein [Pseudonocardia sp. TRM90224]